MTDDWQMAQEHLDQLSSNSSAENKLIYFEVLTILHVLLIQSSWFQWLHSPKDQGWLPNWYTIAHVQFKRTKREKKTGEKNIGGTELASGYRLMMGKRGFNACITDFNLFQVTNGRKLLPYDSCFFSKEVYCLSLCPNTLILTAHTNTSPIGLIDIFVKYHQHSST